MTSKVSLDNEVEVPHLPVTSSNAPRHRTRGKPSADRRQIAFKERKNNAVFQERRKKLEASLFPDLSELYGQYLSQNQTGNSVDKVVLTTTRGIGFHSWFAVYYANQFVPRIDQPVGANVHQLYRYSLMQLARQVQLCEPGPQHTRAVRAPIRDRVSAFKASRNFVFLADAINQVGKFVHDGVNYTCVIKDEFLECASQSEEVEVIYNPQSPDPSPSKRPALMPTIKKSISRLLDPYFLTIFTLRDVVVALSDPDTPLVLRQTFISKNPVPGCIFENFLLTNANQIMPSDYVRYVRQTFQQDVVACERMMDQMNAVHPGSVAHVAMDGKGNELNLCTVRSDCSSEFSLHGEISNEFESYMFATVQLSNVNRLRSFVNLMNEAPTHSMKDVLPDEYFVRSFGNAVHSTTEVWSNLAWNVSPFSRNQ